MVDFRLNKIFVEGETDQKMLATLFELKYNIVFPYNGLSLNDCIVNCKGWTNLFNLAELKKPLRLSNNGKNLIIFDADNKSNEGGFKKRKIEIEKRLKEVNESINYSIYLLPNHSESGDLETFYTSCFKSDKLFFPECWNRLYSCLIESNSKKFNLKLPKSAAMVYSYVDLFENHKTGEYKNAKTKRNYLDDGLWEYDFDNNLYLKSLISFLNINLFNITNSN